ncbi:MAG: hypothetical protein ABSC36_05755 [Gaiellaceae bacterium]|jgi:DNA repair exonuclease SbcCD ATPase subunit
MEEALARARERLEQVSNNLLDPSQTKAAFERARAQMEALAQMGAELEALLPEEIGLAVREGLRAEALPVARQLAELRGLANQLIRRLTELEQEFEAERFARVEDLGLLVDLIAGSWRAVDGRLARMEEGLNGHEATVYHIERDTA